MKRTGYQSDTFVAVGKITFSLSVINKFRSIEIKYTILLIYVLKNLIWWCKC